MKTPRFPLSSDELELLLVFESADSIAEAARVLARDPTVVLRQIQRVAEKHPVVVKAQGRWTLTALGRQVNAWTRQAAQDLGAVLAASGGATGGLGKVPVLDERAALLLVNVQKGVNSTEMGPRNNPRAEASLTALLGRWRQARLPVFFAQHVSPAVGSALSAGSEGGELRDELRAESGETVVRKTANSAFVGTGLDELLKARGVTTIVVAGFATNYCVDATVRSGADLGYRCFVVADASATFDLVRPDGSVLPAQQVHDFTLANLESEFATLIDTPALLLRKTQRDL